jgi:tRNA(adenine34) deaminase
MYLCKERPGVVRPLGLDYQPSMFIQEGGKIVSINQPEVKDEEMMARAIAEAWLAIANGKIGVGALLRWRNDILALSHNMYEETGDITAHAEIVVLRESARWLNGMSAKEKTELTLYTTLEPCLMCLSAISFVGIRRVVYAALAEDADQEEMVVRGVTAPKINALLTRGPLELVPGILREESRVLLEIMKEPTYKLGEPYFFVL